MGLAEILKEIDLGVYKTQRVLLDNLIRTYCDLSAKRVNGLSGPSIRILFSAPCK